MLSREELQSWCASVAAMDLLTLVQVLDALVLQMVDAVPVTDRILQRTLEQVGGYDVEQLVEVPKLSTRTRMPARAFVLGL